MTNSDEQSVTFRLAHLEGTVPFAYRDPRDENQQERPELQTITNMKIWGKNE